MCDASCDKYTFLDVKKAEEEARFDFECREEVLGAGNHICFDDDAQMKTSGFEKAFNSFAKIFR